MPLSIYTYNLSSAAVGSFETVGEPSSCHFCLLHLISVDHQSHGLLEFLVGVVVCHSESLELFLGVLDSAFAYEPPRTFIISNGNVDWFRNRLLSGPASAAMKRGTGHIHWSM
jgi:hypothetical protein